MQPHSQGLSSSRQKRLKRDAFGGKKRDPGNKAGACVFHSSLPFKQPFHECTTSLLYMEKCGINQLNFFCIIYICAHTVGVKNARTLEKLKNVTIV